MSVLFGTPERVDYACDRCGAVFTAPARRMRLDRRGRLAVLGLSAGHALRSLESPVSVYRTVRPRYLARANERAFEVFVMDFRLCGQCRGLICRSCWDERQQICRRCAAAGPPEAVERTADPLALEESTLELRPTGPIDGDERGADGRSRRNRLLGPLLRPGPVRTLVSVAVMAAAWMLVAAEAAYVIAAPLH